MKNTILRFALLLSTIAGANPLMAQWVPKGPDNQTIFCITVSGTNIFAGTYDAGVYRTTDNGAIWTQVNTGLTNTTVTSLAIIGTNVFAGTYGGGVFLSTNNGTSWTAINSGLANLYVNTLAVSGSNIYAGTDGGVFLSSNGGISWSTINTGLTNTYVNALAVSGSTLYAGTWGGGVFRSTNSGANWFAVNAGITNHVVSALIIVGSNVFAGTWGGGVFLSTNSGTSWNQVNTGLPETYINALAFEGSTVYSGTSGGVYLSANNGAQWTSINTGLTNTYVNTLMVSGIDLYAGTWGGGTWNIPLKKITLSLGNNQSGTISSALANPFIVRVTDLAGNPVLGVSVTFAIATFPTSATGQSLSLTTTTTSSGGYAGSTLTLGNMVGTYTVTVSSGGLSGSPVAFTATATGGAGTVISLTSGNNQTRTINTALTSPFVVTVRDTGGNPISGASVTFAIGTVPDAATGQLLSTTTATTNSSGQASSTLTLGNKVGSYTVTASSSGSSGSPITFTATATAGTATAIALTSGNNQTGPVNIPLTSPFVVTVRDIGGNPVSGASVVFAIGTVPASATGQSLSTTTATTNSSGQALSVLTFGTLVGTYTVTATSAGLSGSPRTFTASATAGAGTIIGLTSGNNQTGPISATLTNPFVVTVRNSGGDPVSGVSVTFAIGTVPQFSTGQSMSTTTATTNSNGQASSVLTLGNKVGTYIVTASSSGLSGSPVTFTASATTGTAAVIALTSGSDQTGPINSPVPNPFIVTITDMAGNPVSGASVTFAMGTVPTSATGQWLSTTTATTNGSGQASTALTLGNKSGMYTVTATSSGLSGSPVTFMTTATIGVATTIGLRSGNDQTGTVSFPLSNPFVIMVTDVGGNPVPGANVTFAIGTVPGSATGQSLSATTTPTNTSGQASSLLTLGNMVGTYTVTATSGSLSGSPLTFTVTALPNTATIISRASGNDQVGSINTSLANPLVVIVRDAGGIPVSGESVTFALGTTPATATGQSLTVTATTTNSSGQASTSLRLGNMIGTYTVTATSGNSSGSPVIFTAIATSGTGEAMTMTSGNNQTGAINSTLTSAFVVTVVDSGGNPVSGASVVYTIDIITLPQAANGQSLSTTIATTETIATTDSVGLAKCFLTLGDKIGSYSVNAAAGGLVGSPVRFTATAIYPAPVLYTISPSQAAPGDRISVTLVGENFLDGITWVGFGADITRSSQTTFGDTSVIVVITVSENAAIGGRDVTVRNSGPGGGIAIFVNGFIVDTSTTGIATISGTVPEEFKLYDAYPNPFNPTTTIRYQVPERSAIKLGIYSIQGELISTLVDGEMEMGIYEVRWSAGNVASGVYFCRLSVAPTEGRNGQAGSFVQTKKLILLR